MDAGLCPAATALQAAVLAGPAQRLFQPRFHRLQPRRMGDLVAETVATHRRRRWPARHRSRPSRWRWTRPDSKIALGDVIEQAGPVEAFHLHHRGDAARRHCRTCTLGLMRKALALAALRLAGQCPARPDLAPQGLFDGLRAGASAAPCRQRPRPRRPAPRRHPAQNRPRW